VITWLALDPLLKAFYTLRVFHGQSRRTGEDVRVELRAARRQRGTTRTVLAGVLLVGWLAPSPRMQAAAPAPPPAANVEELDRAIDATLAGSDFQWRLRPLPQPSQPEEEGAIFSFIRAGAEMLRDFFSAIGRWIERVFDWIESWFSDGKSSKAVKAEPGFGGAVVSLLVWVFIAVAVILVVALIVIVWRRTREAGRAVVLARPATPAVPDLQDENTQAAQLPADGWLALAREQMARGEWRLALRALHLATLAQLAAAGLVSLAKFKTNLDYERELRRRGIGREETVARFAARRRGFEAAWYGRAQPAEADARAWLAELEQAPAP
jgi:hypothetical protein